MSDVKPLPLLQSAQSVLATEALSVHRPLAGTVEKLCRYLTDVTDTIDYSLSALKDYAVGTNSAQLVMDKQLKERAQRAVYGELRTLRLPCVPGQTATWIQLLDAFHEPVNMAVNINDNILIPFERYLSHALIDPERFSAATSGASVEIIDFNVMRRTFATVISGNRHIAQRTYGELAERNADMEPVIERTRHYQTVLNQSNPRMVADRIADIRKLTTQLSESLNDSNQKFRLSGKVIAHISEVAYNIAEAVELYSMTMSLVWSHVQAFDDAEKKLVRAM